jgi:hypothetical protein
MNPAQAFRVLALAIVASPGVGCDTAPTPSEKESIRSPVQAGPARGASLVDRLRGAERVVIGTVRSVVPYRGTNEHGDHLILSRISVDVEEPLRGDAAGPVTFELEGGTLGELTLDVSDLPKLKRGERCLFALRRARGLDAWLPSGRGNGILRLEPGADLQPLRQAERDSR